MKKTLFYLAFAGIIMASACSSKNESKGTEEAPATEAPAAEAAPAEAAPADSTAQQQ